MEIRQAILKTAGVFEAAPNLWYWCNTHVPSCGTRGCAAGYIAAFMGWPAGEVISDCKGIGALGITNAEFYERMRETCGYLLASASPSEVVKGLRLYADRYHPAAKPLDWEALSKPNAAVMATVG